MIFMGVNRRHFTKREGRKLFVKQCKKDKITFRATKTSGYLKFKWSETIQ